MPLKQGGTLTPPASAFEEAGCHSELLVERGFLGKPGFCKPMISYAQNFEDVILARLFDPAHSGFYVDVGAADPDFLSVTKWFYSQGWRGLNIEPNMRLYQRLVASRPRDINLNLGAGEMTATLTFSERGEAELSSFDKAPDMSDVSDERLVEVRTLDWIIATYAPTNAIDFLKIDVEGWEGRVLRGIDLSVHRPTAIVVESVRPQSREDIHGDWEHLIVGQGFEAVYFDGLNRFYLAEERAELRTAFSYPPGIFDAVTPALVVTMDHELNLLRRAVIDLLSAYGDKDGDAAATMELIGKLRDHIGGVSTPPEDLLRAIVPLAQLLADFVPSGAAVPTRTQALEAVSRAKAILLGFKTSDHQRY
jgi:FkbM family methyltransferase